MTSDEYDQVCSAADMSGSSRGRATGLWLALLEVQYGDREAAIERIKAMIERERVRARELSDEADAVIALHRPEK